MKRLFGLLVLLLAVSMATPAAAQGGDEADKRVQFIKFDPKVIDGDPERPGVVVSDVRKRASFERLHRLKKDLLPELRRGAMEATLR